jgi:16S rRNA (adenine1518-N6/adenine1519-N6)-dimethyltransferase
MVGMFQKEMAERIIASPGSKAYGIISVLTQAWYKSYRVIEIPPSAFKPPPKVDSLVIGLDRLNEEFGIKDEKSFRRIVKSSFRCAGKCSEIILKVYFQIRKSYQTPFSIKELNNFLSKIMLN